jgi:hypothetical protein
MRWEWPYKTIHPSKGLLKAFRLVPGSTHSALNFGFQSRWRAQQVGLAGFLYVSLDWLSGPGTRERLGAGLQTHTPIERPAQGLSFDAGVHSVGVQVLSVDPFARPAGLT